jgi:hypothetical protein
MAGLGVNAQAKPACTLYPLSAVPIHPQHLQSGNKEINALYLHLGSAVKNA